MSNNPLKITDTILRDAHQSQAATRMRLSDMLKMMGPSFPMEAKLQLNEALTKIKK